MTGTTESERLDPAVRDDLLEQVPDKPRFVMARGLLLSDRGRVLLGPEGRRGAGFIVLDRDRPRICQAVGRPVAGLVEELLADCADCHEIVADGETADHFASLLPGWIARPATTHVHPAPETLGRLAAEGAGGREVRFLGPEDVASLARLPDAMRAELVLALGHAPTVATFVDRLPVAFCYAAYETETWWDVSVGTLEGERRRGHASAAAALLVARMLRHGKRPVWGALDANQASWKMAAKYGFRAVDRMVVFTPPERRASSRE